MKNNIKNISVYGLYIITVIIAISLFFDLKHKTHKIINELNSISPYIEKEDWETCKTKFTEFNDKYTKKIDHLSFILNHEEINIALAMIEDVFTNIELQNKVFCLNSLEELKFRILNFYRSQVPNIINIF